MKSDPDQPIEPAPAERARSILAAATSLTLTTETYRIELIGLHAVDDAGRLTLQDPSGGCIAAALTTTSRRDLAAIVELTDITPVPVRDRVRARLTLGGWLSPDEPGRLRFHRARAALQETDGTTRLGLDELALAAPDPLALHEAHLLTHLDTTHDETVAALSRLAPPRLLLAASRVRPVRLDQYGLVLRLERARTHSDVRLPFPGPARTPHAALGQIAALATQASAHCTRRHSRSRSHR
ncbi:DUF2470 domain-containing protein [Streptomyces sp. NPDC005728]|uniref:DUF2470 domain-containing protein n=1 Tax=Streptomyces sp. NPDC005728 TaxID=3157054 RepID=UPI0033C486CE